MKEIQEYTGFEQGPIRPPSESRSLLVRITRNCPWNKCTFCPVYKGKKFSRRPLEHVLKDIDTIRECVELLLELRQQAGSLANIDYLQFNTKKYNGLDRRALYTAKNFIHSGMQSVFLQDGNSLIIKPDELVTILEHIKNSFPAVERITSYARSKTISKISDEDMGRIAGAGLNRIHIGMESGSDKVLEMVKKGVTKAEQIIAGQKVKRAGIELSEYFMPGLGGRSLSEDNALESADALNQINPDFIRLRTLALPGRAPISRQHEAGEFDKMGDVETSREVLLFLESLNGITSMLKSDHILNLFPEVEGRLPHEKEKMTGVVREFLALERMSKCFFVSAGAITASRERMILKTRPNAAI